jgi:hypothetical protein
MNLDSATFILQQQAIVEFRKTLSFYPLLLLRKRLSGGLYCRYVLFRGDVLQIPLYWKRNPSKSRIQEPHCLLCKQDFWTA